jgi:hypothetical protein
LDEESGYIKLVSSLLPGYKKTPEYGLLMGSSLPVADKDRLAALASPNDAIRQTYQSGDFAAIKLFHDNGIPQVIQKKEDIYRYFMKGKFNPTVCIRK